MLKDISILNQNASTKRKRKRIVQALFLYSHTFSKEFLMKKAKRVLPLIFALLAITQISAKSKKDESTVHTERQKTMTSRNEVVANGRESLSANSYIAIPFYVGENTLSVTVHASSNGNSVQWCITDYEYLRDYNRGKELLGWGWENNSTSYEFTLKAGDEIPYLSEGEYYIYANDSTLGILSASKSSISYTVTREYTEEKYVDVKVDSKDSEISSIISSLQDSHSNFDKTSSFKSVTDVMSGESLSEFEVKGGKDTYIVKVKPYADAYDGSVNLVFFKKGKNGNLEETQTLETRAFDQMLALIDFDADGTKEIVSRATEYPMPTGSYFDFIRFNPKSKKFEKASYFSDGEGKYPSFSVSKKRVLTFDRSLDGVTTQTLYESSSGKLKLLYTFESKTQDETGVMTLTLQEGSKKRQSVVISSEAWLKKGELLENLKALEAKIKQYYK